MFRPVLCGAGQQHTGIPSASGKTQECEHQDIFLSRKPEASLHLQTGRWRAKHPTCPVSRTGQRALKSGVAGKNLGLLQLPPPSCMYPTPVCPSLLPGRDAQSLLVKGKGASSRQGFT